MKIFLALKQIEFAFKLFAAAGFNSFTSAFDAKNENALKEHLQQIKAVEKIVEKVVEPTDEQLATLMTAELREQITSAGFTLKAGEDPIAVLKAGLSAHSALVVSNTALVARNTLIETQLASCGIKLVAADAKVGLTAGDITKAIEDRVSLKAGELTAQLGTRPLETKVTNDPAAKKKTEGLTGLAKVEAHYAAALKL